MYQKFLVIELIEEGQRLLEALARKRFSVKAAMWHYFTESEVWTLVIVSPAVDRLGTLAAYTRVQSVLASTNPSTLTLLDIALVSPRDKEYHGLRIEDISPDRIRVGPAPQRIVLQNDYLYGSQRPHA
jgi:hypothetical protein